MTQTVQCFDWLTRITLYSDWLTLQADRGNIRIGSEFQAVVPAVDKSQEVRDSGELEELQWSPDNEIDKDKIDQFIIISRSVGTFARALDCQVENE